MSLPHFKMLVCIMLLAPLFSGFSCQLGERDTIITFKGDNPPTFIMTGSGTLDMIQIHGQKVREAPGDVAFIVWQIEPTAGRFNGRAIGEIKEITYGQVPEGYKQIYPKDGQAPPLIENQVYQVFFETVNANGARGTFQLKEGKILWKPDDFKQRMLNTNKQ